MNILITGGAGFLGSHLCKRLLEEGNNVISVDNFYSSATTETENLQRKYKNFEFIEADIRKLDFANGLPKIDKIYNLACPASPPIYQKNHVYTLEVSSKGTENIINVALENNATLFHASTSEIYGDPLVNIQSEQYWGNVNTLGIRSCYDEGKRFAETLLYVNKLEKNLDYRLVRIFNTYGPNMNPADGRVVSNFIVQALKGEDITVYGTGNQTRSFCYVDDLINGFIKLMSSEYTGAVNLGNPSEFTILELAQLVIQKTKSKSKIIYCELPSDDPKQRCPDISLAKELLNWEPKVSLSEGLDKTIDYFAGEI
jgi:UDP-glucuronate decarboxylase